MPEGTEYHLPVHYYIELGRKMILKPAMFSIYSVPKEKENNLPGDVQIP